MSSIHTYLAIDLGAESGRAVLGRLRSGRLTIEEVHRFPNEPVRYHDELHWDVARLWFEIQKALAAVAGKHGKNLDGIGLDTWGVDYALLGEGGTLVENPYHYRDGRTAGIMEQVFAKVPKEEIYERTGIQLMPINTLYQLYAASLKSPRLLRAAERLVTMPDLFNFWLTGVAVCEYTNATTTQFYDARERRWSTELFEKLDLPTHLLGPIVQPGSVIGNLAPSVANASGLGEVPVIAPACHDTGSAVAAIASAGDSVFISSGTWSLLGTEMPHPVINRESLRLNFTNEGGVCGTIRLLKNIAGLWLLQCCRRDWESRGESVTYAELTEQANRSPAFRSLVNPDHPSFLHPDNMPKSIGEFCVRTGQAVPADSAAFARTILESLALKYRMEIEALERLTGKTFPEIRIVGGGSKNRLLNQFTADACGRPVVAGPFEATALGNIAMQMLATGAVSSLAHARETIAGSFPPDVFEPRDTDQWEKVLPRFRDYWQVT